MGSWIFDLFPLDVLFYEFDVEVWIFWIGFYILDFLLFEFWVLEFGVQAIPKNWTLGILEDRYSSHIFEHVKGI